MGVKNSNFPLQIRYQSRNRDKMIVIRVILPIFLIGLTSCAAQLEDDAREAVDAFEKALEEFYKIHRDEDFNALTEFFKLEIASYEKRGKEAEEYKLEPILVKIRTNVLNDKRFAAQLTVPRWCTWPNLFTNMLDASRNLGESNWEGKRKLQHVLPAVLGKVTAVMKEAIEELSEGSAALNGARKGTADLAAMITQVKNGGAPSNTAASVAPAVICGLFSMLLGTAPYWLAPLFWMSSVAADGEQNVWDWKADIVRMQAFEGQLGEVTERMDNAIAKFQDAVGKFENLGNRINGMGSMPLHNLRRVIENLNDMRRFEKRLCY